MLTILKGDEMLNTVWPFDITKYKYKHDLPLWTAATIPLNLNNLARGSRRGAKKCYCEHLIQSGGGYTSSTHCNSRLAYIKQGGYRLLPLVRVGLLYTGGKARCTANLLSRQTDLLPRGRGTVYTHV